MRRILLLVLLCAGTSLSTPALADNICLTEAGDPQLTFPGTGLPYVFGVKDDPTNGHTLFLCSPTTLDLSWFRGYGFADFNHDDWEDLILGVAGKSGGEVQVFLNDQTGSGTVVLSATLPTGAAAAPNAMDALDLNGDGWSDIVTANGSNGTFSVMVNDGSGAFPAVKQYAVGSDVALMAVVDVNHDHFPDVITVSSLDQTLSVSLNNGDGTFAAPTIYRLGGEVGILTFGDLNGDSYPDIYAASVSEVLSTSHPPTGSLGSQNLLNNGDGTFTVSTWQPYGISSGGSSFTGSGGVDLTVTTTDFSQMLSDATSGSSSSGITVMSGKVTLPNNTTPATVIVTKNGGSKPSGNDAAGGISSGGGGSLEWLSLLLLGIVHLLRRKRA